jgi:hypothetical protein
VLALLVLSLRVKGTDNENRELSIKSKLQHMDPIGCPVLTAAVCCLLLALQPGGQIQTMEISHRDLSFCRVCRSVLCLRWHLMEALGKSYYITSCLAIPLNIY